MRKESDNIMYVAICDDDKIFRQEMKKFLLAYRDEKRISLDVFEFRKGKDLLNETENFDIVFLDYRMPGIDGLDVARELRARNSTGCIIFITSYPDFVYDSFEVAPYRFFTKPLDEQRLAQALNTYLSDRQLLSPITINDYDGQLTIPSKDIVYLEGDGKYCTIRTANNSYHSSKTLRAVTSLLPSYCFYRTHKSYVVNLYCVQRLTANEIVLTNGEMALIGRSKIGQFKRDLMHFMKNHYLNY